MSDLPEYVRINRAKWDKAAAEFVESGEEAWARVAPAWGIWQTAESDVRLLPANLNGKKAIDLGCGTAYVSAWLARRGAEVVGIDNSEAQLATARRLQRKHSINFPLIHGNAESVPYPDASFDFAISEYGACQWADLNRWIPEASRLLRPNGQLVFLTNSFLLMLNIISRTVTGYDCCGNRASKSKSLSSCDLLREQPPDTLMSPSNGRASGRAKRRGRHASEHDEALAACCEERREVAAQGFERMAGFRKQIATVHFETAQIMA